jgi:hypothetical protein
MTSKERVKAVLGNTLPDKAPWGEWAIDFDTVSRVIGHETFYRAKARSMLAFWEGRREEVVQSWKEDGIDFFRRMDCFDIINISATASGLAPSKKQEFEKPRRIEDNTWEFRDGTVYKYSEVTADLTKVHDPHAGARSYTASDFAGEPVVEPPDESCFEVVDAFIEAFSADRFLMGPSGSEVGLLLLDSGSGEGGASFASALMLYLDNPEAIKAAIRQAVARSNRLDRYCIRPGQDAVAFGQDFSSSQGPFISPELFREIVLPGIKARVDNIHDEFGLYVMKHACGNNNKLMDMFAEAGYDAYQSIQSTAQMDLGRIKKEYGRHLVAWGGVREELLVSGTAEEVREEVRRALAAYKPGGRYIFGSTHSIAVGTRYDNFLAMAEEFDRWRDY